MGNYLGQKLLWAEETIIILNQTKNFSKEIKADFNKREE